MHIISVEFLRSLLRHRFGRAQVATLQPGYIVETSTTTTGPFRTTMYTHSDDHARFVLNVNTLFGVWVEYA